MDRLPAQSVLVLYGGKKCSALTWFCLCSVQRVAVAVFWIKLCAAELFPGIHMGTVQDLHSTIWHCYIYVHQWWFGVGLWGISFQTLRVLYSWCFSFLKYHGEVLSSAPWGEHQMDKRLINTKICASSGWLNMQYKAQLGHVCAAWSPSSIF